MARSERNAHPSVIFRKDSVLEVGAYREEDFPCEDLSLWLRLAQIGKLHGISCPVLKYTLRADSVSSTRYSEAKEKTERIFNTFFDLRDRNQIQSISNTLILYKKSTHRLERKVYLLRDAFGSRVWRHLEIKVKLLLMIVSIQIFLNPQTCLLFLRELRFRSNRRKVRGN